MRETTQREKNKGKIKTTPEQALNKILIQAKLAHEDFEFAKTQNHAQMQITNASYQAYLRSARILADAINVDIIDAAANIGMEIKK